LDDPTAPPAPGRGFLDEARDVIEDHDAQIDERARIEREIDPFLLPEATEPGAGGDEQEVLPGLVVGQELARTLRLHLGDTVEVVSPFGDLGPAGPMPRVRQFRIAGIFYSGMYEFDMKMAYTTVEDAQRFFDLGGAISGIEVKLDDGERAEPVARAIVAAIDRPELRVRAWQEVNRNLFGALQLEKLAMFVVLGIAILVASFCIVASLTLMVQEKRKEVGILKAMGATDPQIMAVFMIQGLMIGLFGAGVGLGLGYLACFAAEHLGVIPLNPEVYYIDRLPVHVDAMEFALVGIAAVVICLLATVYPARLGSRIQPIDALRYS
ncbi:MAG TPA: ABC transporter permease, partial [Sandaracinaceae bacterium]